MTWLESITLSTLRELYRYAQAPISVEELEVDISMEGSEPEALTFRSKGTSARLRLIMEALKSHVEAGRVVRAGSTGMTIPEQLFRPASLLESLAEAAR